MNAHDMVQHCFRHQHPEAYDRAEVTEPDVPTNLRYGRTGNVEGGQYVVEETMGHPEAVQIG